MAETTWKEFGKNFLTHSSAHYLMAIHQVYDEQGYARLSDVAKRLKISKGSLSTSLKPLLKRKLIIEDENKHLKLSDKGQSLAQNVQNTFSVIKHLLHRILKVDEKTADIDACKIEHLLSNESSSELLKMVKALENNPQLSKQLDKAMNHYQNCSVEGCKTCASKNFCLE